jgi:hypothetical protein
MVVAVRLVPDTAAETWVDPRPGEGFPMGDLPGIGECSDAEIYTIPLKITLLYESGQRVTDTDILRLMHSPDSMPSLLLRFTPSIGTKGTTSGMWRFEGEVRYRLEKVSLRNDGRRFKIAVDIDDSNQAVAALEQLAHSESDSINPEDACERRRQLLKWVGLARGCTSCPVTVLSKRKHGVGSGANASAQASNRYLSSQESPARPRDNGHGSPTPKRRRRGSFGLGGSGAGPGQSAVNECQDAAVWASAPEEYVTTPMQLPLVVREDHTVLEKIHHKLEKCNSRLLAMSRTLDCATRKLDLLEAMVIPLVNQVGLYLSSMAQVSGVSCGDDFSGSSGVSSDLPFHANATINHNSMGSNYSVPRERSVAQVSAPMVFASSPNSADTTIVPPWALLRSDSGSQDRSTGNTTIATASEQGKPTSAGERFYRHVDGIEHRVSADITCPDEECVAEFLSTNPSTMETISICTAANVHSSGEELAMPMPLSRENGRTPSWGPIKHQLEEEEEREA